MPRRSATHWRSRRRDRSSRHGVQRPGLARGQRVHEGRPAAGCDRLRRGSRDLRSGAEPAGHARPGPHRHGFCPSWDSGRESSSSKRRRVRSSAAVIRSPLPTYAHVAKLHARRAMRSAAEWRLRRGRRPSTVCASSSIRPGGWPGGPRRLPAGPRRVRPRSSPPSTGWLQLHGGRPAMVCWPRCASRWVRTPPPSRSRPRPRTSLGPVSGPMRPVHRLSGAAPRPVAPRAFWPAVDVAPPGRGALRGARRPEPRRSQAGLQYLGWSDGTEARGDGRRPDG